jgi:hypothetical protein
MTVKERQLLSKLPHTLTVYRGFSHAGGEVGFSWTLKQTTARFFADYACGSRRAILTNCMGNEPAIASGSVHKQDVFALLVGRREREIIIGKPESVFNVRVKRLKPSNQNGGQAR